MSVLDLEPEGVAMPRSAVLSIGTFVKHFSEVIDEIREGDTLVLALYGRFRAHVTLESVDLSGGPSPDEFCTQPLSYIEREVTLKVGEKYLRFTPISEDEEYRMISAACSRAAEEAEKASEERKRRGEPELLFTSEEVLATLGDVEPDLAVFRQEVLDEWRKAQVLRSIPREPQPLVVWREHDDK